MNLLKFLPQIFKSVVYKCIYFLYFIFRPKYFLYLGKKINYENSFYNTSFFNERSIEIPLIKEIISKYNKDSFLEIGNVLAHYSFADKRDIVDKYEVAKGVINEDIETFSNSKKYNLIVSISTLEHVGLDEGEDKIDPRKLQRCIDNIVDNLLEKGGFFIATLPVNYNKNVDDYIYNKNLFQDKFFVVRDFYYLNTWRKIDFNQITFKNRAKPLLIEEVFIGIYRKN